MKTTPSVLVAVRASRLPCLGRALAFAGLGFALLAAPQLAAQPQSILPVISENATMQDRLGAAADLELEFVDEDGAKVKLRDLVTGKLPIVLNLGYFNCPNACGPILANILDGLKNAALTPGEHVQILSVSIDENEGPAIAKPKQHAFIESLGIPAAKRHWRFLTGDAPTIRKLADSVGYRYERNEALQQIDHPPVIVMLSPAGIVTRYLDGDSMTPVTFKRAVVEAGAGTVGSFLDRILVSCLTYDPETGVYSMTAMTIMRVGGALTVIALGLMVFVLWRRERHRPVVAAAN